MNKLKTTAGTVANSTNFTLQMVMLLIYALAEFTSFSITEVDAIKTFIEGAVITVIGFWGNIREWLKSGVKFRYTGNALTYLFAFLGGIVEWIGAYDLEGAVGSLIEALQSGNSNLLFPAIFALGNILWRIINDKPWQTPEPATT